MSEINDQIEEFNLDAKQIDVISDSFKFGNFYLCKNSLNSSIFLKFNIFYLFKLWFGIIALVLVLLAVGIYYISIPANKQIGDENQKINDIKA